MKINTPPNEFDHFLMKNFYIGISNIPNNNIKVWYSKIDNSYFTLVGNEEKQEWLFKKGITEQLQSAHGKQPEGENPGTVSLGFNSTKQKWYGWSHRAVFGFGIGSTCKQGDCGFKPSCKEEFKKRELEWWGDIEFSKNKPEVIELEDGILITYVYNDKVPNVSLRGTTYEHFSKYPKKWGKGEWEAKTLEDAKQMAIDFAESVS